MTEQFDKISVDIKKRQQPEALLGVVVCVDTLWLGWYLRMHVGGQACDLLLGHENRGDGGWDGGWAARHLSNGG